MTDLIEVWQQFNNSIFTNDYPDGMGEIEGLVWQKPNGTWIMMVGDPTTPGRVMRVAVHFNPWTGEKLPTDRHTV